MFCFVCLFCLFWFCFVLFCLFVCLFCLFCFVLFCFGLVWVCLFVCLLVCLLFVGLFVCLFVCLFVFSFCGVCVCVLVTLKYLLLHYFSKLHVCFCGFRHMRKTSCEHLMLELKWLHVEGSPGSYLHGWSGSGALFLT